jgi:steroid delta-isomerase-like uncharacterized protein
VRNYYPLGEIGPCRIVGVGPLPLMGDHAALVDAWVETFNAQDVDRHLSLLTDDFAYQLPRFNQRTKGIEAHRQTVEGFIAALPDRTVTVQKVIEQGDDAAVVYTYEGTSAGILPNLLPPKGETFTLEVCAVFQFRAGKIAAHVDYC